MDSIPVYIVTLLLFMKKTRKIENQRTFISVVRMRTVPGVALCGRRAGSVPCQICAVCVSD